MRATAAILLVAAWASAQEQSPRLRANAALREERFHDALRLADDALRENENDTFAGEVRAEAIAGLAREAQRKKGYAAALAILEPEIAHPRTAWFFAQTCIWAGREEWGLDVLARAKLSQKERAYREGELLYYLGRLEEAADVARAAGLDDWWYRDQADLRVRFAARTRRAGWLAVGMALLILGAAFTLKRLAPVPTSS